MNTVALQVTVATMLLHLSLGCCWHHAHGCAAHGVREASACCSSQDSAGCLHSADDHDADEQPCGKSATCKEVRCQLLSLSRAASAPTHSADAVAIGPAELLPVAGECATSRPSAAASLCCAASHRRQILLI